MKKERYIETLVSQIRCKKAREAVAEELGNHIEEAAKSYEDFGLTKEAAYEKAIKQMGDPVEIGVEMDRIHRPRIEWRMLGLIFLLSILGLLVQYRLGTETGAGIFGRQCVYTVLGIGVMLAVYLLDYSILGKYAYRIYWGYVLLFLVAKTWGKAEEHRFQYGVADHFAMLPYLFVPVFVAILYRHRGSGYGGLLRCLFFAAVPLFLCSGWASLLPGQNGLSLPISCRLNLAMILEILLILSIAKGWFAVKKGRTIAVLLLGLVGLPGAGMLAGMRYFLEDYQRTRILSWFLPEYSAQSYGKAAAQSILEYSRLVGQTGGQIPRMESQLAHREYVFVQLLASFGILAGMCVLLLLMVLILRVFHMSIRQQNVLGQMLGAGCGLVFLAQVLECVLLNLGIGMESVLFLPFFSYGGSATLVCYLLLGLVLSIYRYKDIPNKIGMRYQTFS